MVGKEDAARKLEKEEKPKPHEDEVEERDDQLDPEETRIFPI